MEKMGVRVMLLTTVLTVMDNRHLVPMTTEAVKIVTVTRHFQGDIFSLPGSQGQCTGSLSCWASASASGGTANRTARPVRPDACDCQCLKDRPVFREDTQQCVETLQECTLAEYVNGDITEKVPLVFLPQKGQLINPSAQIALADVRVEGQSVVSPVCVVSKAHFLTADSGWKPMDNSSDSSAEGPPLALYRESGRTYLQWLGDAKLRPVLEGRIALVKLLCKDTANARVGVFSPCIAFRVAGTPGFSEGVFQGIQTEGNGLKRIDYLAIGVSGGLLTFLYIVGLAVFLCYRRRRNRYKRQEKLPGNSKSPLISDSLTCVNPASQTAAHLLNESMNRQQFNADEAPGRRQYQDSLRRHPTTPTTASGQLLPGRDDPAGFSAMDPSKRVHFTPTYFDPELLKSPPPGALEFLGRIRGMMGLARGKMAARRFMPSLIDIPEEYGYGSAAGSTQQLHQIAAHNYGSTTTIPSERNAESTYGSLKKMASSKINSLTKTVKRRLGIESSETNEDKEPSEVNVEPIQQRKASIYTNPSIDEIYNSLQRPVEPQKTIDSEDTIDLTDILSEAESKVPKIYSSDSEYSADTLQRHLDFEVDSLDRVEYNRRKKERLNTQISENQPESVGYVSSASTSVKSLSCLLPRKEELEFGNQLFNTNTGAKTLPKPVKTTEIYNIYEIMDSKDHHGTVLESPKSQRSSSSTYSVLTVLPLKQEIKAIVDDYEEVCPEKLTIEVDGSEGSISITEDDDFDPDTLEKRPFRRIERHESFADSLERPNPTRTKLKTGGLQIEEPPPRPPKAQQHLHGPPLLPRKDLKSAGSVKVPDRPPKKRSELPSLPPRSSAPGGDHNLETSLVQSDPSKQDQDVTKKPSDELRNARNSLTVLERIAEIESGSETSNGLTKGMEIALALRAKMDLEGSLRDGKRSLSIKKTWRKFIERVEDSFSEADTATSSAASSIAGTLRRTGRNQIKSNSSAVKEEEVDSPESVNKTERNDKTMEAVIKKPTLSGSSPTNESFDSGLDSSNYSSVKIKAI